MELVKIGKEGVEMAKKVKFGIGFVTGRPNVCRIVNSYYKDMLEQVSKYKKEVELTIFILFDTSYQQGERKDFYVFTDFLKKAKN